MKDGDVGIWLDEREALIIHAVSGQIKIKRIVSNVETYHPRGGSRSKTPYGPQEVISESGYLSRKKQQLLRYFHKVIEKIESYGRIYILGPAEAKDGLRKEILKTKQPNFTQLTVETTDRMTDNQLKAKVRSHFKGMTKR